TETLERGIPVTRVGRIAHVQRMSVCPTFYQWMKEKKPDLVHVHMINPMAETAFLMSGLDCKVVATYHMDLSRHRFLYSLYRPLQRRFLKRTEWVTASSENFAQSSPILSRYLDKVRILPFGLAEDRFLENDRTTSLRNHLIDSIQGKLVLFVGRLIHYKGLEFLIQAMTRVEANCLLIGEGYLAPRLQKLIEKHGLADRVRLLGSVSDEELLAYYDRADVFVLPSVNRTESYGLTQLEAMARGTPVICTEIGTGTSFINRHNETGLVVPPKDSEALANAINLILSDTALASRLSQAARARREELFSQEKMFDSLRALYAETL
ncbi:MAG: glycosyltransferase, partial [Candidatus Omnitrophica bacterium]|nr:glycosyltransferase [Candidatus Omnitrophota bacterium]